MATSPRSPLRGTGLAVLSVDGSECPNCERLEAGTVERCPACGTTMQPVHDLFHRAMQRTFERSGSVEIVHGAAEKRLLEVGGPGAAGGAVT